MRINKESLLNMGESVITTIVKNICKMKITDGAEVADVSEDIMLKFTYNLSREQDRGSVILSYQGRDIGTIKIDYLDSFIKSGGEDKVLLWKNKTRAYLQKQLAKFFVSIFMETSESVKEGKSELNNGLPVTVVIPPLTFTLKHTSSHQYIKAVGPDRQAPLYENIRWNSVGVTTEQGFQGISVQNLFSEVSRVLIAAIDKEMVTIDV